MLMCVGMGGWFAYDGYVGYINHNISKLLEKFPPDVRAKAGSVQVYPGANLDHVEQIKERLRSASLRDRAQALRDAIGGPPSIDTDKAVFYFGQDCLIKVEKDEDRLGREIEVTAAEKTTTDFQFQKRMGIVVGAVGLYMLFFLFRVIRTRAEVSDAGLSLNGRKPIPFSAMKSLDSAEFRKKGKIYLVCDGDPAPQVLLDEYHYADFDTIIAGICEKTGFEDPVAAEKAEKAAKAKVSASPDADSRN